MDKGTILLVEDNDDDVELTLRAMRRTGIENAVIVARDGGEALDYLLGEPAAGKPRNLPWIVLLDLKLPRIDGLETLTLLRASEVTKLLPIIILTSSNEEQDVLRSYRLGANSYLRKPVDFRKFTDLIQKLHGYWEANEVAGGRRSS